ncbi:hypothetical protein ES703_72914 [subsurface metagenome]
MTKGVGGSNPPPPLVMSPAPKTTLLEYWAHFLRWFPFSFSPHSARHHMRGGSTQRFHDISLLLALAVSFNVALCVVIAA